MMRAMNSPSPACGRLRRTASCLLCLLSTISGLPSASADEGIVTDRPDFVESSEVVGPGRFQLETGVERPRDREGSVRTRGWSTGTLLRWGTGERTELRLETDGFNRVRVRDDATGASSSVSGMSDLSLGVKWHARDGDAEAGMPSMAWLLHVELPTGAKALRGRGARPSLRAVAEWELPQGFSLGVMPGVAADTDDDGRRFAAGILAATLGKDFGPLHGFVEVAGQRLASRTHGGSVVTFDTGVAWQPGPDWQLDVSLQKGLSSAAPDLQWGVGIAVRF
jgi:hypothetical protein